MEFSTMGIISANQNFKVIFQKTDSSEKTVYDNNGLGFPPDARETYEELGDIPITIRYAGYNTIFTGGILTVIMQYTEEAAHITVESMDGKLSKTITMGGTAPLQDIAIFRVFDLPEAQVG